MVTFIAEHAIAVILSIIITGIVTATGAAVRKILKMFKSQNAAILAMNHDRLYQACTFYIMTNQITFQELSNLEYLYTPYAALGGNGTGQQLYDECQKLPKVSKRTRWHEYYEITEKEGD